jgi:hypothetical protein
LQFTEPDLNNVTVHNWHRTVFWEYCHPFQLWLSLLEHLDRFTPPRFLIVVDLAQVQDLPLDNTITLGTSVFHNTPVAVFLAVLETGFGT